MKTERRGLILSAVMSLVLGSVALVASRYNRLPGNTAGWSFQPDLQRYGIFSVRVATLLAVPDNEKYPFGFAYFESLVNAAKGLLILGVGLLALGIQCWCCWPVDARSLRSSRLSTRYLPPRQAWSVSMILLGRVRRHTSSPLVEADYANWRINTTISASVLIAFCLIPVANMSGWSALTPYVDP